MKTKRIMALFMAMVMMLNLGVTAGAEEIADFDDTDVCDHCIYFDLNDGKSEVCMKYCSMDNVSILSDGSYVIIAGDLLETPTRKNYAFEGWYTAPTGGHEVTANTVIEDYNLKLYAHWTKSPGKKATAPGHNKKN